MAKTSSTKKIVHNGVEKELTTEAISLLKEAGEKFDTVKADSEETETKKTGSTKK